MNPTFQGALFDGETLAARPVTVTVAGGRLLGTAPETVVDVSLADVQVSDRLADVPRYLYLPGGGTIETMDNAAVDSVLSGHDRGRLIALVHALEIHSRAAAVAAVLLVATTAMSLWWGLPVLARHVAQAVPDQIEAQVGQAGLAAINRFLLPTELSADDRTRVQVQLDRLVKAAGIQQTPRLVLRSMGGDAANAFALPGGIIIFSDELVRLADSDDEIAAVLAHEIGHWQRRHGIQGVLRSSAALLVVSTVTGDLSTLTTFAGTIPFTLLQRGYSREFEAEADRYAVDLLRKAKIDPQAFARILDKLERTAPGGGRNFTYLSTHPSTDDRIKAIAPGFVPGSTKITLAAKPAARDTLSKFETGLPANKEKLEKAFEDPPVELGSTDKPPVALTRRAPQYPFEMRKKSVAGSVTLEFIINKAGKVQSIRTVRSTHAEFEAAAVAAVQEWTFSPGERNGRIVAVRATQLLEFDPDEDKPAPNPDTPQLDRLIPDPPES